MIGIDEMFYNYIVNFFYIVASLLLIMCLCGMIFVIYAITR